MLRMLEFDIMKNFKFYFIHNNVDEIIKEIKIK